MKSHCTLVYRNLPERYPGLLVRFPEETSGRRQQQVLGKPLDFPFLFGFVQHIIERLLILMAQKPVIVYFNRP